MLSHAQDKGVEFCPDLPLVPTLQEVKDLLSREARAGGPGGAPAAGGGPRPRQQDLTDCPQAGERTFFLGKGKRLGVSTADGVAARNAIGFFLFTRCKENGRGEWPQVLGSAPQLSD